MENNIKPKIGDYAICDSIDISVINENIKNNIGEVKTIGSNFYTIEYDFILHEESKFTTIDVLLEEILHLSENKKDLEIILKSNEYNL